MKKTYQQITKKQAKAFSEWGTPIKIMNQKTGKIRPKNATYDEIFKENHFYFVIGQIHL